MWPFPPSAVSAALETEDSDLRSPDFNRKSGGNVAGRHRDFLRAVGCISDHSAGDRAADLLTPQLLAGGGVERIKVAAHVAKEHEASGGRRHGAQDRVIGLQPPLPHPRVGVDGVKPSRPDAVGARELSEHVERIEGLLSRPRLPDRGRYDFVPGLQLHRRAPVDVAGEDEIGHRVVGRAVPFLAAPGAGTKMDVLLGRKGLFHILDSRHRRPVQELVVGAIESVEETVLRRHRHQFLAAPRLKESGRVGDVPIVPIPGHDLVMILVGAGLGVEDDDRVGIKILALARADVVVRRRIAYGHIQEPRRRVQGRGSPGSPAADRRAGHVFPRRVIERGSTLGPADGIALGLGHEEEFPHDLARLGVERVHAPLPALEVAAGIADEDEPLPGDRRRRHGFALLHIRDRRFPQPLAGLEIVGQHPPVLGPAKQHAIEVRRAAIGR